MRHHALLAIACTALSLPAQNTVQDVGLTLSPGVLTVIYGQVCGPFSCTPASAGALAAGSANEIAVWAASNTPFVVGISAAVTPTPCLPLPGLANALLLDPAAVAVFGIGVIPQQVPMPFGCQVSRQNLPFVLPPGAPSGLAFRLQAVGTSASTRQLAFSSALDSSVL